MYETKRLILGDWQDNDIEPFIQLNKDPKVMEFFPHIYSKEDSTESVKIFRKSIQQYGYGMFTCRLKANDEFIGFVGLMRRDIGFQFSPCVEIGWRIAYQYWGQGLAVEAAYKCLDIGFNKFNLDEIVSFTASINKRSERVMQKLGMQRDYAHDFYHPKLDSNHPLARHILYRLGKNNFIKKT
ncbi:MAG: GNAT family N-acetyltransferase [Burkholderiales bacterium]|nr:GNAT family N-acetyltransferase [Burkholderiales bacterium]